MSWTVGVGLGSLGSVEAGTVGAVAGEPDEHAPTASRTANPMQRPWRLFNPASYPNASSRRKITSGPTRGRNRLPGNLSDDQS